MRIPLRFPPFIALSALLFSVPASLMAEEAPSAKGPIKVVLDCDFSHFSDDHEAFAMLNSLQAHRKVQILGITLVSGNSRMPQLVGDALRAVERLGHAADIPVAAGATRPLVHDEALFQLDRERYGAIYAGAWSRPETPVTPPPDGTARRAELSALHAVDFLIGTIRENPHEVKILALGPLTNIALAIRKAPDIVPLIDEIIYMGGSLHAFGNVTAAAEFNWWFDAEAAAMVLAEPVSHTIVPLDATDTILFRADLYQRFAKERHPAHQMTKIFLEPKFAARFAEDATYVIPVWDTLVPALLASDTVVKQARDFWVSVDHNEGPSYGRLLAYPASSKLGSSHAAGTRKARIILELDETEFWSLYEELLFDPVNDYPSRRPD